MELSIKVNKCELGGEKPYSSYSFAFTERWVA